MKTNGMGKRIQIFTLIAIIVLTMQGPRVFAESLQPEKQPETTEEATVSGNDLSVFQSEDQPVEEVEQTDAATDFPELTDDILNDCILSGMNPPGVTVNLFDYWQDDNNERGEISHDQERGVLWRTYNIGISRGHLLRFGYRDVNCDYCKSDGGDFGEWNNSQTNKPYAGIVKNKLGAYGFPVLNFDTIVDISKFGRYADPDNEEYLRKKEESLDYLFSPSVRLSDYKETYIDVQGLFRPDGDGYYFYNSTDNFASYNRATNSFILYNSPGVAEANGANEKSCGQFFPFNTAKDVFDTYTVENGKYHLCYKDREEKRKEDSYYTPISINNNSYLQCSADRLNHYLGMTLEFSFQQPENGCMSNGKPMTFEFSGDDDVWIFIDGVLVADLGGLHNACSLDIDFSTGNVEVEGERHTLLKSFKEAYGEDSDLGGIAFSDNTFVDNTVHTFKMFYLERGHGASDLALKFNVQTMPDEPVEEEPPKEDNDNNEPPPKEDNDNNEPPPKEDNGENEPPQNKDTDDNESLPSGDNDDNQSPSNGDNDDNQSPPNGDVDEYEESAPDIISVNDSHIMLDTTGIPQTGDDSMIGWFSALCVISLLGIGAAVYNLIFSRRKQKNHSSKH